MSSEPALTLASLRKSSKATDSISAGLHQALHETAFSNRRRISPRRLDEIGREEAGAFLEFLKTGDEKVVLDRGEGLAREGLGHRSVLMMTETLRVFCRESVNPGDKAAGRYAAALLEGYMAGRENVLLNEQERTREAYLRARDRSDLVLAAPAG